MASGRFDDGTTRVVDAAKLTWSVSRNDDTPPGEIAAGVLQPYPDAGGVVTIRAGDGCIMASFDLELVLERALGPAPADPGEWAAAPVTETPVPSVIYPSDQTRFPRNIYRTVFQWQAAGSSEFRLTFEGAYSVITVYSDGVHPDCAGAGGAGCWEADEAAWSYIAGSNAGGTVTLTVDALDRATTPPTVRRAEAITLGFSRRDVEGAIFYWSTTSAGIRRANIAAAAPEDYITGKPGTTYDDGDKVKCVACHVVSRDGRYIAAPVDADSGKSLWIMEVSVDAPPPPMVKQVDNTGGHGFATISPDNEFVAVTWGDKAWVVRRDDGSYVEEIPFNGTEATQPDWSPNGDYITFATGKGDGPGGAGIARISYGGQGVWGAPEILAPAEGDRTNLFPMYSPEGDWIAYAVGKGGHGDVQAQLFLVPAAGGTPVELVNANRVVSNELTDGQHQNSQPTWAPPGDLHWIAFNSKRDYGVIGTGGKQQIWVAAVDVSKVGSGEDPSYPAFRIPFQGLNEDNHRAYWTLDVRDDAPPPVDAGVPPADAGQCVATGNTCDPVSDVCCDSLAYCDTNNDIDYLCQLRVF
ncbi:TolB family protein [Haliangium sp.]|uniref:TolB family protein n=1 Tax=Haliangium sp. TaxID=2663208 RepID=UPI003D0C1170